MIDDDVVVVSFKLISIARCIPVTVTWIISIQVQWMIVMNFIIQVLFCFTLHSTLSVSALFHVSALFVHIFESRGEQLTERSFRRCVLRQSISLHFVLLLKRVSDSHYRQITSHRNIPISAD